MEGLKENVRVAARGGQQEALLEENEKPRYRAAYLPSK